MMRAWHLSAACMFMPLRACIAPPWPDPRSYFLQAQWQNLTRARFATEQTFTQYSPISVVDQVKAPLMIIAGKQHDPSTFLFHPYVEKLMVECFMSVNNRALLQPERWAPSPGPAACHACMFAVVIVVRKTCRVASTWQPATVSTACAPPSQVKLHTLQPSGTVFDPTLASCVCSAACPVLVSQAKRTTCAPLLQQWLLPTKPLKAHWSPWMWGTLTPMLSPPCPSA